MQKTVTEMLYKGLTPEWRTVIRNNYELYRAFSAAVIGVEDTIHTIYPTDLSKALGIFTRVKPDDIKVVLLGQDPYPNAAANGIAFAAEKVEPSLRNIFACMSARRLINSVPTSGNLDAWIEQGVFLMNTAFTVGVQPSLGVMKSAPKPRVHKFWHPFTRLILKHIEENTNAVFILLGVDAHNIADHIDPARCRKWGHPSPMNAVNRRPGPLNFINCTAFDDCAGIDWNIAPDPNAPISRSKFAIYEVDAIYLFTDGAVVANGKPGARAAWAYKICDANGVVLSSAAGLVAERPNNQTAELRAILEGFKSLQLLKRRDKVILVSDSRYSLQCIFEWIYDWRADPARMASKKHLDIIVPANTIVEDLRDEGIIIIPKHVNSHQPMPAAAGERFIWQGNDDVDAAAGSMLR